MTRYGKGCWRLIHMHLCGSVDSFDLVMKCRESENSRVKNPIPFLLLVLPLSFRFFLSKLSLLTSYHPGTCHLPRIFIFSFKLKHEYISFFQSTYRLRELATFYASLILRELTEQHSSSHSNTFSVFVCLNNRCEFGSLFFLNTVDHSKTFRCAKAQTCYLQSF